MTDSRHGRLDAVRAVAMLWMAAFHLAFDLNYFGFLQQNFYTDPRWTVQRTCIVSLFLLCAGVGQAVAVEQGQSWTRFWKRWAQVATAALLVSIGSWIVFPRSFIYFGVLHGIAVMLLMTRLGTMLGKRLRWLFTLGVLAVAMPLLVQSPIFDGRSTDWVGLVTRKPITEDWVPLLPWIGVMMWGFAAGCWMLRRRPQWLRGSLPTSLRPLAVLGRSSLAFYLLHQPILFGTVAGMRALTRAFATAG